MNITSARSTNEDNLTIDKLLLTQPRIQMHPLLQGILLGLTISVMPGAPLFTLLQTSIHRGLKSGFFLATGIFLSDVTVVYFTFLGALQFINQKNNYMIAGIIGGFILIDQLWAPCRSASRNLIEQEIAFYQYHAGEVAQEMLGWFSRLANQVQASSDDTCMLPLGWGSGYDAKTVTDLVEDTLFEQVSNRSRFTHRLGRPGGEGAWLHSPLVPKTRKVVVLDGQYYPMGWVKLVRRA